MRELLRKEGMVTMYEEEAYKMAQDNEDLKQRVSDLESSLQKYVVFLNF